MSNDRENILLVSPVHRVYLFDGYSSITDNDDDLECENSTGNLNGIQHDYSIVNKVIYDRTDDANPPPLPSESNIPCIHSIIIDPSTIPNDGERVVLLSLVSRVEKNMIVKNEVMSGRLFQLVYQVNSNSNLSKILQIVLPIFLQLVCGWILKKYQVDNDTKKMDWILKWYRVDIVYESLYCNNVRSAFYPVLLSLLETPFSQRDENNPVDSFPTSAFVDTIKLKGILNQYRVDIYGKTAYD